MIVEPYGNGYRPTGDGTIGGRRFYFRMNGSGDWAFGVERADTPPEAWAPFFTSDEDLQFYVDGSRCGSLYHTEALPVFVEAIERYLHPRRGRGHRHGTGRGQGAGASAYDGWTTSPGEGSRTEVDYRPACGT